MTASVGRTPPFRDESGRVVDASIAEAGAWKIGGVDQWVMIRGRNRANPLLVILHGGPGGSETAMFRAYNSALEDEFTIVYWDQRGAGRSYSRSIPPDTMTIPRFVADLDDLVEALLKRFGRRQVILLGHSWGSVLGVLYTRSYPGKVAAYVGTGQVANMAASEAASYEFTLVEAEKRGRRKALERLRAIGPPPHTLKTLPTQRRWLLAFGGAYGRHVTLASMLWRALRTPEASLWDIVRMLQGSNFSIRYLWEPLMALALDRDCTRFSAPIFFILGRLDMQVVASVSADYFAKIEAPKKELFWLEEAGHFAPFEQPAEFNRILIETVRPLAL